VWLLSNILETLVFALEVLHEKSSQFELKINWAKSNFLAFDDSISPPSVVSVLGHDVNVVDSWILR